MSFLRHILLFCLLTISTLINGYAIDPVTCQDNQRVVMEKGVAEAFLLVDDAYNALQAGIRNADVGRLFGLLFGDTGNLAVVRRTFGDIQRQSRRIQPDNPLMVDEEQIMFYCNLDRVQISAEPGFAGKWVDSVTGRPFDAPSSEKVTDCKSKLDTTLGVTWNPFFSSRPNPAYPASVQPFIQNPSPSQITICPWFLGWAVNQEFKMFDEVIPKVLKVLAAKFAIPLLAKAPYKYPFAPIDAFGLLGKVILHELTHTIAGGETQDVVLSKGAPPGFKGAAYGWRAALILAKEGGANHEPPTKNADSYALFASGVRLLNQSPPLYITNDGGLTLDRQ